MIKVNVISLDETYFFTFPPNDKQHIRKIMTVYAYNPEEHTYCCEITPSFELRYLYSFIVLETDVDDETREALHEKYCSEGGEDIYMHCSRVKPTKECGEFETMDEAIEYLQGNCPI